MEGKTTQKRDVKVMHLYWVLMSRHYLKDPKAIIAEADKIYEKYGRDKYNH